MLILGQTGVGKSSLINSLVGHKVEETSVGKPCTPEGIFPHEETICVKEGESKKNADVVIYDSWGIEIERVKEWKEMIDKELEYRSPDKDIKYWYHNVTYCINAGGDKIQDFDINIIKQFIEEKYDVVIALTKADQISEDKEKEFIEIIKKETGVEKVIPISASPQKLRGMTETPPPFGLDNYQVAVLDSWKKIFIERVPYYICTKIKNDLESERDVLINKYKGFKLNNDILKDSIIEDIEQFFKNKISFYAENTIKKYYNIQMDIVSLNNSGFIHNFMNCYDIQHFYKKIFFSMDFKDILRLLLPITTPIIQIYTGITFVALAPVIGIPLVVASGVAALFAAGKIIKTIQREKLIDNIIDTVKDKISEEDFILNIKDLIIKCLEETDKKLSEYSEN